MNTKTFKHRFNGWTSETTCTLKNGMELEITTLKRSSGKVVTYAQAMKIKDEGGWTSRSFMMFQDFNKQVMVHDVKRATDKTVSEAHAKALENVQALIDEANEFYAKEVNA